MSTKLGLLCDHSAEGSLRLITVRGPVRVFLFEQRILTKFSEESGGVGIPPRHLPTEM